MKLAKRLVVNPKYISYLSKRLANNIFCQMKQFQNALVSEPTNSTHASYEEEGNMLVEMNSRFIEFNRNIDMDPVPMLDESISTKDLTKIFFSTSEMTKSSTDLIYNDADKLSPAQILLPVDVKDFSLRDQNVGDYDRKIFANDEVCKKNIQSDHFFDLNSNDKVQKVISKNWHLVNKEHILKLVPSIKFQKLMDMKNHKILFRYSLPDDYENECKVIEVNEEQFKKLDNFLEGLESEEAQEEREEEAEAEAEAEESSEPTEQDENSDDSPIVEYSIKDLLVKGTHCENILQTYSKITNSDNSDFIKESFMKLLKQSTDVKEAVNQSHLKNFEQTGNEIDIYSPNLLKLNQLKVSFNDDQQNNDDFISVFQPRNPHLAKQYNEDSSLITEGFLYPVNSIINLYFSVFNTNPFGNHMEYEEIYDFNEAITNCNKYFNTNEALDFLYQKEEQFGFDFNHYYNKLSHKYENRDEHRSSIKENLVEDEINYYNNILKIAEKRPNMVMENEINHYYLPLVGNSPGPNEESYPLVNKLNGHFLSSTCWFNFTSSNVNPKFEGMNENLIHEKTDQDLDNMDLQVEYFMELISDSVHKFTGYNAPLKTITSKLVRSLIKDKLMSMKKNKKIEKEELADLVKQHYDKYFEYVYPTKTMSNEEAVANVEKTKKGKQINSPSNFNKTIKMHCTVEHMLILCNPYLRTIPQEYVSVGALEKFLNLSAIMHVPDINKREELTDLWKHFSSFITDKEPTGKDYVILQLLKTLQQIKLEPNYLQHCYTSGRSLNEFNFKIQCQNEFLPLKEDSIASTPQEVAKVLDMNMKQFYKLEKKVTRSMLLNRNCLKVLENSRCFFNSNNELIESKPKDKNIVLRTTNEVVNNIADLIVLTEKKGNVYNDLQI